MVVGTYQANGLIRLFRAWELSRIWAVLISLGLEGEDLLIHSRHFTSGWIFIFRLIVNCVFWKRNLMDTRLEFLQIEMGRPNEKHAVSIWNLGNISAMASQFSVSILQEEREKCANLPNPQFLSITHNFLQHHLLPQCSNPLPNSSVYLYHLLWVHSERPHVRICRHVSHCTAYFACEM
jgi:hypothetical protein